MNAWTVTTQRFLTDAERAKVLALASRRAGRMGRKWGTRDHTTLLAARIMGEAGLRASEACGLRLCDCGVAEPRDASLTVIRGKGGKPRSVMIAAELAGVIAQYVKAYRHGAADDAPLLVGKLGKLSRQALWARMAKLATEALGETRRRRLQPCHSYRHSCAVGLLRATRNLRLVQMHLGHSSPVVTSVYAQVVDEERRAGVEQAFGAHIAERTAAG